jgi:hypothetical protein
MAFNQGLRPRHGESATLATRLGPSGADGTCIVFVEGGDGRGEVGKAECGVWSEGHKAPSPCPLPKGEERTLTAGKVEATDREIDRLVYELFGLSEEEIRLVEGATV